MDNGLIGKWSNRARVLQNQNQFQERAAGKWCKDRVHRKFSRSTRATSGGTRAITILCHAGNGDVWCFHKLWPTRAQATNVVAAAARQTFLRLIKWGWISRAHCSRVVCSSLAGREDSLKIHPIPNQAFHGFIVPWNTTPLCYQLPRWALWASERVLRPSAMLKVTLPFHLLLELRALSDRRGWWLKYRQFLLLISIYPIA